MAKKRLKIKDKQGNVVDYDISSASVTIDIEGKSLDVKLSEIATALLQAVTEVTFNGTPYNRENGKINLGQQMQADWNENNTNWPAYIRNKPNSVVNEMLYDQQSRKVRQRRNGVVEDVFTLPEEGSQVTFDEQMSSTSENGVQNKVIKAYVDAVSQRIDTLLGSGNVQGAIDTFNEVVAFLNGISSSETLAAKLLLKADKSTTYTKTETDNAIANAVEGLGGGTVQSVSVNGGEPVQPVNGNVNLQGVATEDYVDDAVDDALNDVVVGTVQGAVIDNLRSDSSTDALSAGMGKQLAEDIDEIPNIAISVVGNKIVINTNAALSPRVIISELSSNSLSCRAGQTATATFKVSGRRLTAAITAALSGDTTHFSVSPASVSPISGVVEETTLTVTYTPGNSATAGTTHSLTITIASGGVTYGTLELTGTVAAAPSITLTPASQTISAESGQQGTGTINVKGTALDADVTLTLSNSSYMSFEAGSIVTSKTIAKADAMASGGANVTIYYTGTAADSGTITASSTGATSVTTSVSGSVRERLAVGDTITEGNLLYTVLTGRLTVSVQKAATAPTGAVTIPSTVYDSNGLDYSVVSIPAQGFQGAQITSIVLPDTLIEIGGNAFFGCSSLASIDLGDGVENIGNNVFYNTMLTSITFPDSLRVCKSCLAETTRLTTIQLGKTTSFSPPEPTSSDSYIKFVLKNAGSTTSAGTENTIKTIICYAATPPTITDIPIGLVGAKLKVPSGSITAYTNASKWNEIGTIEAI